MYPLLFRLNAFSAWRLLRENSVLLALKQLASGSGRQGGRSEEGEDLPEEVYFNFPVNNRKLDYLDLDLARILSTSLTRIRVS